MRRFALLVLVACGGTDPGSSPDASDTLDVTTGSVTMLVTERGVPVVGLPVFFRDADTARLSMTGELGSVGLDLDAGGSVTVLQPRSRYGTDQLSTFAEVEAGDVLHLDLDPLGPPTIEVAIAIPAATGAAGYQLHTSCGGPFGVAPGPAQTFALEGCNSGTVDLLVLAYDDDSNLVASLFSGSRSLTAPITVAGTYTPYVATMDNTLAYTNVDFSFLGVYQAIVSSGRRVYESTRGDSLEPGVTEKTFAIEQPGVTGATMLYSTTPFPHPEAFDEQVVLEHQPAGPYSLDLRGALLTPYTSLGAFEIAARRLVWTEAAGGSRADLVRAGIRVSRRDLPAWTWQIVAPRVADPVVTFPELPVLASRDLNPQVGDIVTVTELTNVDFPVAYAAELRANAFADLHRIIERGPGRMVIQRRYVVEPSL
ncbi:MAG: hypothetical protein H0T89_11785 [Deltaproteobacteria bacterium]|nr:hypothetical protein [Deltaproteobacteria bacterium]